MMTHKITSGSPVLDNSDSTELTLPQITIVTEATAAKDTSKMIDTESKQCGDDIADEDLTYNKLLTCDLMSPDQ